MTIFLCGILIYVKSNFVGGKKKENSVRTKGKEGNVARSFQFKELAMATQNFRDANLIGEGGFGSVYKGRLESGLASSLFSHLIIWILLIYPSK